MQCGDTQLMAWLIIFSSTVMKDWGLHTERVAEAVWEVGAMTVASVIQTRVFMGSASFQHLGQRPGRRLLSPPQHCAAARPRSEGGDLPGRIKAVRRVPFLSCSFSHQTDII